jgi:hypothetical protein
MRPADFAPCVWGIGRRFRLRALDFTADSYVATLLFTF